MFNFTQDLYLKAVRHKVQNYVTFIIFVQLFSKFRSPCDGAKYERFFNNIIIFFA